MHTSTISLIIITSILRPLRFYSVTLENSSTTWLKCQGILGAKLQLHFMTCIILIAGKEIDQTLWSYSSKDNYIVDSGAGGVGALDSVRAHQL